MHQKADPLSPQQHAVIPANLEEWYSKAVRQNEVMGWQVTQQTKAGTTPLWLSEIKA